MICFWFDNFCHSFNFIRLTNQNITELAHTMKTIGSTLGLSKKELIALCRYYKGESERPYDDDRALLWDYDCKWYKKYCL